MTDIKTDHLARYLNTLEKAYSQLIESESESIDYDIYRYATVKGFELSLETAGKLVRKILKPYFANPKDTDRLIFKDIFRHAGKHDLLSLEEVERWIIYRENRNLTAHDYGKDFAEKTLKLIPDFINDVKHLIEVINNANA